MDELTAANEMKNKIFFKELIALIEIIKNQDDFNYKLESLISNNTDKTIRELIDYDKGKNLFISKKVKDFYKENEEAIESINKVCGLFNYIYSISQKPEVFEYYYNYLLKNIGVINDIENALFRLNRLGISVFYLNENVDFTKFTYKLNTSINYNSHIYYLDNIDVIPTYESGIVRYRTSDSPFAIKLHLIGGDVDKKYHDMITNTLLLDINRFPSKLNKETTFDRIISLRDELKDTRDLVISSVDLSVGVDDISKEYTRLNKVVEKIEDSKTKEELTKTLENIKSELIQLSFISSDYRDSIVENNEKISNTLLKDEKQKYLKRREAIRYDID